MWRPKIKSLKDLSDLRSLREKSEELLKMLLMRFRAIIFFLALSSCFTDMAAQIRDLDRKRDDIRNFISGKMSEEPFRSGLTGIVAVTLKGDTLAELNSLQKLLPASNTKLISTGLALRGLGPEYKFVTRLGYTGSIVDGVLNGDLYIIGGGDPTIGSEDAMSPAADSLFSQWKRALNRAGIKRLNGKVIGDGRFFDGPIENAGWGYEDLGTDYGAGCNGLCYSRNIQTYKVMPTSPGRKASVSEQFPETPWLEFRNNTVTATAGTGDNLYLFNTDNAPVAEMRGSIAINKGGIEHCSNKYGAMTCAWQFASYLEKSGMSVAGVADVDSYGNVRSAKAWKKQAENNKGFNIGKPAAAQSSLSVIASFNSPAIWEIAKVANDRSDNFYAETLLRILAKNRTDSATYDSCNVVIARELDSLDVDSSYGIQMVDGSGLSRHNYMSPDFFCRYLTAMSKSDVSRQYFLCLSGPGRGTMSSRLKDQPDALKKRVRMKSGSMDGVVCFSGYILPATKSGLPTPSMKQKWSLPEDTIVFSIMTNNMPDNQRAVRKFIDDLIVKLACTTLAE